MDRKVRCSRYHAFGSSIKDVAPGSESDKDREGRGALLQRHSSGHGCLLNLSYSSPLFLKSWPQCCDKR